MNQIQVPRVSICGKRCQSKYKFPRQTLPSGPHDPMLRHILLKARHDGRYCQSELCGKFAGCTQQHELNQFQQIPITPFDTNSYFQRDDRAMFADTRLQGHTQTNLGDKIIYPTMPPPGYIIQGRQEDYRVTYPAIQTGYNISGRHLNNNVMRPTTQIPGHTTSGRQGDNFTYRNDMIGRKGPNTYLYPTMQHQGCVISRRNAEEFIPPTKHIVNHNSSSRHEHDYGNYQTIDPSDHVTSYRQAENKDVYATTYIDGRQVDNKIHVTPQNRFMYTAQTDDKIIYPTKLYQQNRNVTAQINSIATDHKRMLLTTQEQQESTMEQSKGMTIKNDLIQTMAYQPHESQTIQIVSSMTGGTPNSPYSQETTVNKQGTGIT